MKTQLRMGVGIVLVLILGLTALPVGAQSAGVCGECHSRDISPAFPPGIQVSRLAESGNVYQHKIHPCPAVRSLAEENFLTESQILRLEAILQRLQKNGWGIDPLQAQLTQNAEAFSSLKEEPIRSSSHFAKEAAAIRSRLQKVYDQTVSIGEESDRRWLIGMGSLVFLALLVFVGIGYRKLDRIGKLIWLVGLSGALVTLSACSSRTGTEEKSPAQAQVDQSLVLARQVSGEVEETFRRSILLAEMGRDWALLDGQGAERSFELAWKGAFQAREKSRRLQGLEPVVSRFPDASSAAKEKVDFDSVLDLRDQLRSIQQRTWAMRAVAEEWLKVNPAKGRQALENVFRKAAALKDGEIRDRELRAIAEAWAAFDSPAALEICRSIQNLLLRSMALREVGRSFEHREKREKIFAEAWQAATEIQNKEEKLYAMIRIAAAAAGSPEEEKIWAQRIGNEIRAEKNLQLQSWLMLDLVQMWGAIEPGQAERWGEGIGGEFPESRAYALLSLANTPEVAREKRRTFLGKALTQTEKVSDPFEKKKLKRLVIEGISQSDPEKGMALVAQVENAYDRSRILAQIARQEGAGSKEKGLAAAEKIPIEEFRQASMVEVIGQWTEKETDRLRLLAQQARQASSNVPDPYQRVFCLIEIGKLGQIGGTPVGSRAFETAWKTAGEISSSWKKAAALEAIGKAWEKNDPEKAGEVLQEIDPEIRRVRASLSEVRLWAPVNPEKAWKIAEEISEVYPLEKARALKEAALAVKNSRKKAAWEGLEKSLQWILPLPDEGTGRRKFLGEVVGEMAHLDGERTLRMLENIQPGNIRDALLAEAAKALIQTKSLENLQRAHEGTIRIQQGSLRLAMFPKIADAAAEIRGAIQVNGSIPPALVALSLWGMAREQAKQEEVEAIAFFERAREAVGQVKEERERAYLASALAADWALLDEEKAFRWMDQAAGSYAEPFSYGLLQVASQLKRWNRKEAQGVFAKALAAGERIDHPYLRVQRKFEIGRQWWEIDEGKGKELLSAAREEAEMRFAPGSWKEEILEELLLFWAERDPQSIPGVAAVLAEAKIRAVVLSAAGNRMKSEALGKNEKRLDEALQFAQKTQNPRLQGRVAAAWYPLRPSKTFEIIKGIESAEARSEAWSGIGARNGKMPKEEANRVLDLAFQEALKIDEGTRKIIVMKNLAGAWAKIDPDRAQKTYRKIYQIAEKEFLTRPTF
jgi:hypothetical protein